MYDCQRGHSEKRKTKLNVQDLVLSRGERGQEYRTLPFQAQGFTKRKQIFCFYLYSVNSLVVLANTSWYSYDFGIHPLLHSFANERKEEFGVEYRNCLLCKKFVTSKNFDWVCFFFLFNFLLRILCEIIHFNSSRKKIASRRRKKDTSERV